MLLYNMLLARYGTTKRPERECPTGHRAFQLTKEDAAILIALYGGDLYFWTGKRFGRAD